MKIVKQFIPIARKLQRSGIKMIPKYITIHSTGNPSSTARNEADYVCWNSTRQASFHYVVGPDVVYQVLPTDEVAWHAGDGCGIGNMSSIAIEMVESGERKAVIKNTICLVRELMDEYAIPISHVVQHYDWSKKNCPRILRDKTYIKDGISWARFMSQLKNTQTKEGDNVEKIYNKITDVPSYWKDAVEWAKACGIFNGDGKGFGLTETEIKALVFIYNDNKRRGTL